MYPCLWTLRQQFCYWHNMSCLSWRRETKWCCIPPLLQSIMGETTYKEPCFSAKRYHGISVIAQQVQQVLSWLQFTACLNNTEDFFVLMLLEVSLTPKHSVIVIKNKVNGFSVLSSGSRFNLEQWNCPKLYLPLPRINMPQRTTTGVGAGSCDIGVILSVRDIIRSGTCLLSFQWEFKHMGLLWKQLMCRIFKWRNNANWLSILLSWTNLLRHLPQDHERWSILNGILAFPLSLNTMLSRL